VLYIWVDKATATALQNFFSATFEAKQKSVKKVPFFFIVVEHWRMTLTALVSGRWENQSGYV